MIRLRCDHLDEFIVGRRMFYTVGHGHPHKEKETVILFNDYHEYKFKIVLIQDGTILSLEPIKEEVAN